MKTNVGAALVLSLGVLCFLGTAQAGGGKGFSNASLQGKYVVSFQGWVSGGDGDVTGASLGPQNGVGLLIADGKGNFTGTQTANILYNSNGNPTSGSACGGGASGDAVCTYNLAATYAVNSDGTGSTTATATPITGSDCRCGPAGGFTTTESFVMQSADELSFVGTDLDATVSGHARKQAKKG